MTFKELLNNMDYTTDDYTGPTKLFRLGGRILENTSGREYTILAFKRTVFKQNDGSQMYGPINIIIEDMKTKEVKLFTMNYLERLVGEGKFKHA